MADSELDARYDAGWAIIATITIVILANYIGILRASIVAAMWKLRLWKLERAYRVKMNELLEKRLKLYLAREKERKDALSRLRDKRLVVEDYD